MFKTTIVFEVLSKEPLGDADFEEITDRCHDGDLSGDLKAQWEEEVTDDHMEHLLLAQRSSPSFLLEDVWEKKKELEKLEFAFETTGGRSIELAKRIYALREEIEDAT